jgi:hypothetical protein
MLGLESRRGFRCGYSYQRSTSVYSIMHIAVRTSDDDRPSLQDHRSTRRAMLLGERAIVCDYARPNTDNPGTFLYLQFAEPADGKPINITSKN